MKGPNLKIPRVAKDLKKCSSSSDSSTLPLELVIEILSRVPAKSLCKWRCVSKQWLHLLSSDPHFKSLHRRRSLSNPPLLLFSTFVTVPCPMHVIGSATRLVSLDASARLRDDFRPQTTLSLTRFVISCCNLVCLVCCGGNIYVCNPSTRDLVQLPHSPNSINDETHFAFGVLPASAHYKIVCFFGTESEEPPRCEVFSLVDGGGVGSGSWREIEKSPVSVWYGMDTVSSEGFVYIMPSFEDTGEASLLSLDLERERFGTIGYPRIEWSRVSESGSHLGLAELNGFLCLVELILSEANVWMLVDRENSVWVKQYTINYNGLGSTIELLFGIAPKSEDQKLLVSIDDIKYYYYYPKNKRFRRLKTRCGWGFDHNIYCDGLFSLRSN